MKTKPNILPEKCRYQSRDERGLNIGSSAKGRNK